MTYIYHMLPDSDYVLNQLSIKPAGEVFWMLDADSKAVSQAKDWLDNNYGSQKYEQYWAKGKDGKQKPAYWIIDDKEIAMAFKLAFCGGS